MSYQIEPLSYFSLYPNLPAELRSQIYWAAFPDHLPPALHLYKRGCWGPRYLTEADVGYESDSADDNFVLEFCCKKLGVSRFNMPLAAVTSEARDVALTWAAKQGVEVQQSNKAGRSAPIFACRFQPERDILYVPLDCWEDLFLEPIYLPFEREEDFLDKNYSTRNEVRRIAVPESLLQQDRSTAFRLNELIDVLPELHVLYVIMDPQPIFNCSPESDVPWRREVIENQAGGWDMVWNSITRGWHIRSGGAVQETDSGVFYRRLLEAAEEWQEGFGPYEHDYEICVVHCDKKEGRK